MLKQDCTATDNQCTTRNTNLDNTKTLLNSIIGTTPSDPLQINTDGINFGNLDQEEEISEEEIKRISEEIRKKIPNDINSFFYIKDIDQTDETDTSIKFGKLTDDFNNTTLTQEITSEIQKLFISKNEDETLKIEGLNLLTPDRPIDSPRYITFQGINAQEVKFIYPDLYKVEVYKADSNGYQTLKTPTEIKTALQTYLQNKVNEYNTLLTTAKNTKQSMNAAYNKL
ncbi:MAG: hypothetical protein LBG59_02595 [Candidatus Peribacteria bacterium]|jgi:hypothetical protein|nr:hypothetical protein [Candidatus Peribacteria bacterium]